MIFPFARPLLLLMLVIPAYIYKVKEMHDVVIFGELLAVATIIMCLLFVIVDLGRPERFWHLIPVIGLFNFPISMLSWDVVVLNGYSWPRGAGSAGSPQRTP